VFDEGGTDDGSVGVAASVGVAGMVLDAEPDDGLVAQMQVADALEVLGAVVFRRLDVTGDSCGCDRVDEAFRLCVDVLDALVRCLWRDERYEVQLVGVEERLVLLHVGVER